MRPDKVKVGDFPELDLEDFADEEDEVWEWHWCCWWSLYLCLEVNWIIKNRNIETKKKTNNISQDLYIWDDSGGENKKNGRVFFFTFIIFFGIGDSVGIDTFNF